MPRFLKARRMWTCDECKRPIFQGWIYVLLGKSRYHDSCMPSDCRERHIW